MDQHAAYEEARSVRKGEAACIDGMAEALAHAFFEDPVFSWVLRHDPRRMRVLRSGFALFLRRIWLEHEQTYTTAGTAGAAVWEPPGMWKLAVGKQLGLLPAMLGVFRRHSPRVLRSLAILEAGHPSEPEFPHHYYLASSVCTPSGKGVGSAPRCSRPCSSAATARASRPSSRLRARETAPSTNGTASR
jgi:hypothetical protein